MIAVVVPIGILGVALIAYCWKRMGRDVFIAQPYNIFTSRLSKPSRPFRRGPSTPPDDSPPAVALSRDDK